MKYLKKVKVLKFALVLMVLTFIVIACFVLFEIAVSKADVRTGKWNNYSFVKIEKAKREDIPVLLYFTADWCDWCVDFEKKVLKDEETKELLNNYLLIKVDRSNKKDIKTKIIKNMYKVKYIPAVFIFGKGDSQKILVAEKDSKYFNVFLGKKYN